MRLISVAAHKEVWLRNHNLVDMGSASTVRKMLIAHISLSPVDSVNSIKFPVIDDL